MHGIFLSSFCIGINISQGIGNVKGRMPAQEKSFLIVEIQI
jgi:hypothetical protein